METIPLRAAIVAQKLGDAMPFFKTVGRCVGALAVSFFCFAAAPADAQDDQRVDQGASVLMYHRFGENDIPSTNTTLEQFEAHLAELKSGGYSFMTLAEIARRLKAGETFPEKTIGVSVDDAYLSVYKEAWPRLKKAGIPFTIFIATESIDKKFSRYMSWDQIREMAKDPLVAIGSQTAGHLHMIDADAEALRADLIESNARFKAEIGYVPDLIAYPYGEFDDHVIEATKAAGFVAGFGQHSGAVGLGDDLFRLARFAMNESYGDIQRVKIAAAALPLPTSDFIPEDTVVDPAHNPPLVGFTVPDAIVNPEKIACFTNHEGKLKIEILGPRVELRMKTPMPQGRTRLNCTMPAEDGRWRWLGRLFYVK